MTFNLRGVDLNLLTVFEAIMEAGKLSLAAEQLGMSQPAISAALQRLRLTIDDPLFVRTRQGMHPTPKAQEWYRSVKPALEQIRTSLATRGEFDPTQCDRVFSLIAGDYFEMVFLGSLLQTLQQQAPDVGVNMLPFPVAGLTKELRMGQVDFALHYRQPEELGLDFEEVGEEHLVVLARAQHPRIQDQLSLEQYAEEGHVIQTPRREDRTQLDLVLGEHRVQRRLLARVSQLSSAASVVESTDCLCTVPSKMGQRLAARFQLQVLPFPLATPPIQRLLIWPKALAQDAAHHWFKQRLIETVMASDKLTS